MLPTPFNWTKALVVMVSCLCWTRAPSSYLRTDSNACTCIITWRKLILRMNLIIRFLFLWFRCRHVCLQFYLLWKKSTQAIFLMILQVLQMHLFWKHKPPPPNKKRRKWFLSDAFLYVLHYCHTWWILHYRFLISSCSDFCCHLPINFQGPGL